MSKNKLNIGIGVATGLLIGFVFGTCFGPAGNGNLETTGNVSGNASMLSIHKIKQSKLRKDDVQPSDTLNFTMTDDKGNSWNVTMNKQ